MGIQQMIWFTSDWHFNHNKDFIYKARGFTNVEEMNEAIIASHNALVKPEDDVYCLGDLMMGQLNEGIEFIKQMNGRLHVIIGNHDTPNRLRAYSELPNIVDIKYADMIKQGKRMFYLSHYPTIMTNGEELHGPWNLHGHTHCKSDFEYFNHKGYNVAVDAHNCCPVEISTILMRIAIKKMSLAQDNSK